MLHIILKKPFTLKKIKYTYGYKEKTIIMEIEVERMKIRTSRD